MGIFRLLSAMEVENDGRRCLLRLLRDSSKISWFSQRSGELRLLCERLVLELSREVELADFDKEQPSSEENLFQNF